MKDIEVLLASVDTSGRYQKTRVVWLAILLAFFGINGQFLTSILLFSPGHRCKTPFENDTETLGLFLPTQTYHGVELPSKCSMYRSIGSNTTIPCPDGYIYDETVGRTLVDEFNLVCENTVYKSIILGFHMALMQIMMILAGITSDRFGRKIGILMLTTTWSSLTCLAAFATNFWWFIVPWLGANSIGTTIYMVCNVMANEMVSCEHRPLVNGVLELAYAVYCGLLPLLAHFSGDWRVTSRILGFLGVALTLTVFFLDESPRWLLTTGRDKDAERVLEKIARVNKTSLTEVEALANSDGEKEVPVPRKSSSPGFAKLFILPHLRRKTIIFVISLFGLMTVLFGPPAGLQLIKLNPYFLFSIQNFAAAPPAILVVFFVNRFGRVRVFVSVTITAGVSCAIAGALPNSLAVVSGVGIVIARSLIGTSFILYYILATEVLPTELRSRGHSVMRFASGMPCAGVPFLYSHLADELNMKFLPFLISGVVCVIGSLLVLFIPETKGKPLTDLAEESERQFPVNFANAGRNLGCRNRREDNLEELNGFVETI